MTKGRTKRAATVAAAAMMSCSAASATSVINLSLSDTLTDGGTFTGSFNIASLLNNGSSSFAATSATLKLSGTSVYGTTGTAYAGTYSTYVPGYSYSYSCGWGGTCYTYIPGYSTNTPYYTNVDQFADSLTLSSGGNYVSGHDFGQGYPASYYGDLVAQLGLGAGNLIDANSTGLLTYSALASTNTSIHLTEATLFIELEPITSAVPEPATWAMMLIGFGAIGSAMRKKRRKTTRTLLA